MTNFSCHSVSRHLETQRYILGYLTKKKRKEGRKAKREGKKRFKKEKKKENKKGANS